MRQCATLCTAPYFQAAVHAVGAGVPVAPRAASVSAGAEKSPGAARAYSMAAGVRSGASPRPKTGHSSKRARPGDRLTDQGGVGVVGGGRPEKGGEWAGAAAPRWRPT